MQPAPIPVDVCIVGGGIAGLAAACALKQAGASVTVVERRIETGDPNRGDWIFPKSVALLAKWGVDLSAQASAKVQPLLIKKIRVESGDRTVTERAFREKEPSYALPSVQLELLLREAAKRLGVDLRLGWQAQLLLQPPGANRISGLTALNGAQVAVFNSKLVVGADGRGSWVRDQVGLKLKTVDATHEMISLEADLQGSRTADRPDAVVFSVGAQGGGFLAPITTDRVRVFGVVEHGQADALLRGDPEKLTAEMIERTPLPVGASIDMARMRSYESASSGHPPNYAVNGAVCIGDAAHPPPMPALGGIEMALRDAEALARIVGPAAKIDEKAVDKALTKFETERWPENEARLERARQAIRWMLPLDKARLLGLKTPAGGLLVKALLASD